MKFVLGVEKELNIGIDFANSIDSIEDDSDHQFGRFVAQLDKHSSNQRKKDKMRIDQRGSDEIYDALANPELDNVKRKQFVQYLIDFYISKTHMKLEPVGYLEGRPNTETFGISNLSFN